MAAKVTLPRAGDGQETSLVTAIQEQLGLKLEARKIAMKVLVIERADRVPVEN